MCVRIHIQEKIKETLRKCYSNKRKKDDRTKKNKAQKKFVQKFVASRKYYVDSAIKQDKRAYIKFIMAKNKNNNKNLWIYK